MESLLARKSRPSLNVELLEGRQLLSQFAEALAPEAQPRPIDRQAEISMIPEAPAIGPATDFSGDRGLQAPPFSRPDVTSTDQAGQESAGRPVDSLASDCASTPVFSPALSAWTPPTSDVSAESTAVSSPLAIASTVNSSGNPPSTDRESSSPPSPGSDFRGASSGTLTSLAAFSPPAISPLQRGGSGPLISRSVSESVQSTARVEVGPAGPSVPTPARSNPDETWMAFDSAISGPPGFASSPDLARGPLTLNLPVGSGLLGLPVASTPSSTPLKGIEDLAKPPETPGDPDGGVDEESRFGARADQEPSAGGNLGEAMLSGIAVPEPALGDLILSVLQVDRSTLEAAIDQFLEPFDDFALSIPELRGPMGLITASLATAATVVAVEVAIKRRRARDLRPDVDDADHPASFPVV